jgi:hypothetical protein
MKSPRPTSTSLALIACSSLVLGLGALRAEDKKKDPPAKPAAAVAKPAAPVAARPAPAPKVAAAPTKPLVQKTAQPKATNQLKSLHADTQSRGAAAAGGTTFDGRKAAPPAVKANPSTVHKTPAQISAEQNAIPRAQPYKMKKSAEPPSPPKQ